MFKNIISIILLIYSINLYASQNTDIVETIAPERDPVAELTSLLSNVRTMSADFKQVVINKNGVYLQEQTGKFQLKKPNLLRWQVLNPDQMLIVTDGSKIWHYDEDLAQVIIKNFNQEISDTKISKLLLGDSKEILANFDVNILENTDFLCFELTTKNSQPDDNFIKAELSFDDKQQLVKIKAYDQLSQETEFLFSNIKSSVDSNAFKFIMPKDVDVIED